MYVRLMRFIGFPIVECAHTRARARETIVRSEIR